MRGNMHEFNYGNNCTLELKHRAIYFEEIGALVNAFTLGTDVLSAFVCMFCSFESLNLQERFTLQVYWKQWTKFKIQNEI